VKLCVAAELIIARLRSLKTFL